MRGDGDEIDATLRVLGSAVGDRLSHDGWMSRSLDRDEIATATRQLQNGVIAVVALARTSSSYPDYWPVEVEVSFGVGFEPALDLMPLLTLDPRPILIQDPEVDRADRVIVDVTGPGAVEQAAARIARLVRNRTASIGRDFPDAAAIDARLQLQIDAARSRAGDHPDDDISDDDAADDDAAEIDFDTRLRLVLLAATGQREAARALLGRYPVDQFAGSVDSDDRRFIRQLTRWLDAGCPTPPPVEETLQLLPRRALPRRSSWSDVKAKSGANKAALDAVRAQSAGKSVDELRALIASEYAKRGIDIAPSAIELGVEMLRAERQPFGRIRNSIKALRMLKDAGGDLVHLLRHPAEEDPAWLRPPDRACYPMIGSRRYTGVQIDRTAFDLLQRAYDAAPEHIGMFAMVDVWFTLDSDHIVAHLGQRRVGRLPTTATAQYAPTFRAAGLFDEDPFVRARLSRSEGTGNFVLEVPSPELTDPADPS